MTKTIVPIGEPLPQLPMAAQIIVVGRAHSGKSSIADAIARVLSDAGLDVYLCDEDDEPGVDYKSNLAALSRMKAAVVISQQRIQTPGKGSSDS